MDGRSVCPPLFAESDSQNNTTSTPNAASVTDADTVINTKTDSNQVEGDLSEEELLKDLLTDDYCHVCEAVLLFESQRLSHYETMTTDKNRFCELCNMVFSSQVVAKSHYEGKIHTKNLRKQGLQSQVRYTELQTLPSVAQDPENADQKSAPEGGMEHHVDPAASTATPSPEVDLKDPNKYCSLCAASFNNPQMALQHYNGRKHQRNQARQELIQELGDDSQQANSLTCQMCSVQFNSVEMYQAHMQGNKHQIREKKVVDLCKSQQKVYNTFADELADYIQVQKARGITPNTSHALPQGDTQKENQEDEEEEQELINRTDIIKLNKPMPNLHPTCKVRHQSRPGYYFPAESRCPPYQGPPWPTHCWDNNYPAPVLSGSGSPQYTSPLKRRRRRKQSSSSSFSTSSSHSSSYSSSYTSSTSDSDDSDYRRRKRRRIKRSRKERGSRGRDEDLEKKRRRKRRERNNDYEARRREESGESEQDRLRNKRKNYGKQRRKEKKSREEDFEEKRGERLTDSLKPEDIMDNRKETEVHIQAEIHVDHGVGGQDEPVQSKNKKDKKKIREKVVDTRTEEEKLWDDSILGC
uniref:Zinc finger matrin-type 1 n=1 Tax=Mastacembelus armatus TaxID=205130 RepID=A0A3Q3N797_9TELE